MLDKVCRCWLTPACLSEVSKCFVFKTQEALEIFIGTWVLYVYHVRNRTFLLLFRDVFVSSTPSNRLMFKISRLIYEHKHSSLDLFRIYQQNSHVCVEFLHVLKHLLGHN